MKLPAVCLLLSVYFCTPALAQDVALSFEDAPSAPTPLLGDERTNTLIATLKAARVDQAIFFAVGKNVEVYGTKRLKQYAEAGHFIGSQGYSQRTVDELGSTEFVKDMKKNDLLIRDLPGFQMWFRFPHLNQGSTADARDNVRVWIYHMLYGRAQVTINSPDAALDHLVQAGITAGHHIDMDKLRHLYVTVMMECIQHYDRMARSVLGRSPKHLLRLHENDLAALFLGDLVAALQHSGGHIIPAIDALDDELNRYEANVVPLNGSQIMAVAEERGLSGISRAPIEDQANLELEFTHANIWQ